MSQINLKRVLIVDDEPEVALTLSRILEKLGQDYIFEVAYTGHEALAKLHQSPYDLLITDYSMPGMNGLDLVRAVRQISPKTQVVLMSAHGSEGLRDQTRDLDLYGYLDKPFSFKEIHEIVKRAIGMTQQPEPPPGRQAYLDQLIDQHLRSLQIHSGAQCVLLISANGYPVGVVGRTVSLDVSSVGALVAGNFMAAAELANMLGSNRSVFKSSYHEGADYNIYAYDVNGELLLAVIFGPTSKPGIVWFYTKQTAAELSQLVADHPFPTKFKAEVNTTLDNVFDDLFDSLQSSGPNLSAPTVEPPVKLDASSSGETNGQLKRQREDTIPLSFEQAVAAGLVPPQLVKREQK